MKLYLIPDYCRIEGKSGRFLEWDDSPDLPRYDHVFLVS